MNLTRQIYSLIQYLRSIEPAVTLPYDNTNPVVYDKDDVINCYSDDYLMALASAGDIQLVGMITSSTIQPYNQYITSEDYDRMLARRLEGVYRARKSGFRNIPEPVCGPKGHLRRPETGKIEDTRFIGVPGSWLIVNQARKTSPDKPLVVVMGGALTAAADAYLLDNTIADRLVVAWAGGTADSMKDYNGYADAWAAYIVLQRLRLVQFPSWQAVPYVPKARLRELPDTELRRWMMAKRHSKWKTPDGQLQPGSWDGDAPPAISLMRRDYARRVKRVSFGGWTGNDKHQVPLFQEDPNGRVLVVTKANERIATEEWWRALKNPAAYLAI